MRILFIISVFGHGSGGHFHSLNHITKILSKKFEVKIITIGPGSSSIIESNSHFFTKINFNGLNFLHIRKVMKHQVEIDSYDVIHFFDYSSYNIFKIFLLRFKGKIFVSKCGGPIINYFPYLRNLILFSEEDADWFNQRREFSSTFISVIPNRVGEIQLNTSISDNNFSFLRICRIGPKYKSSIIKSINLINQLKASGLSNVRLNVIGKIEDENVFNDILDNYNTSLVNFHTDSIYTKEASRYLNLGKVIIGTGRGLMEAASVSKPLLVIDNSYESPILINNIEKWNRSLYYNFSERINFEDSIDDELNLSLIIKLVNDSAFYSKISKLTHNFFLADLSIEQVLTKYEAAYDAGSNNNYILYNIDLISIFRTIYFFIKASLKANN